MMITNKIDAGLELISAIGAGQRTINKLEVRDLLYKLITKDYTKIDEILEQAQKNNLLTPFEKAYLMTPHVSSLQFEKPRIIKQEERGHCRYCGKKLNTAFYVVFTARQYGPFGASCIGKMKI